MMIIELDQQGFDALVGGEAVGERRPVPGSALAPPEVLEMLRDLAAEIAVAFSPSAWMIVEEDEIVGLASITRPPDGRSIHIGYGVVPAREGRGIATRAIGQLIDWARTDPRVDRVSAETGADNIGSRRVLERNGFRRIGERIDEEDGPVVCWEIDTAPL